MRRRSLIVGLVSISALLLWALVRVFAGGVDTVVTAAALADNGVVIDTTDSAPAVAVMAIVTLIGAGYMVYWFS